MRRVRRRRIALAVACAVLLCGCFEDPQTSPTTADSTTSSTSSDPSVTSGSAIGTSSTATSVSSTGPDGSSSGDTSGIGSAGTTGGEGSSGVGTSGSTCGDAVLDDDEECDGGGGCTDCELDNFPCNPLNSAGCVAGLRCGVQSDLDQTVACFAPGDGALGSPCDGSPANDSECGDGLTCLRNANTPLCDVGNCCVSYCDLTDPVCPVDTNCRQFFPNPLQEGLERLGYCGVAA